MSDPAEPTPAAPATAAPQYHGASPAAAGSGPGYSGPPQAPQYADPTPPNTAGAWGAAPHSAPAAAHPGYTAGLAAYQGPGQPVGPGQSGPSGQIRSTGTCVLLTFVTLGV
jgi:hypothetical protein